MEDAARRRGRVEQRRVTQEQARRNERLEILRLNLARVCREMADCCNPRFSEQLSKEKGFLEDQIRQMGEPPCSG
jgi:hypothetical protein